MTKPATTQNPNKFSTQHISNSLQADTMTGSEGNNKRKISTPTEGYICSICSKPGHWVQQCPDKKRKKANKNHVYTPGVDPSEADIARAREMQKIKPPNCFCGIPSRIKKVKRSHATDNSRAVGKYFFFCSKRKDDTTKCRFARPVEDETKPKKDIICSFFAKRGFCMRGDRCMYKHEVNTENQASVSNEKDTLENAMESHVGENNSAIKEDKKGQNITNDMSINDRSSNNGSSDDSSSDSDSSTDDSSSDSKSSTDDSSSDSKSSTDDDSSNSDNSTDDSSNNSDSKN